MKKVLMTILIVVLAMGLVGSTCVPEDQYWDGEEVTFKEVSQPYLNIYGQPDIEETSESRIQWTWDLYSIMLTIDFYNWEFKGVDDWEAIEHFWYMFKQVSQPYLDEYGLPEDIYTCDSGGYHIVDWWWWSKGFKVAFCDSPYNGSKGWTVDSEFTFPPI